jgi:hypothetical protein
MAYFGTIAAVLLISIVFIDAFEAMILPRRVRHGYRLAALFYRNSWWLWRSLAGLLPPGRWRNGFLSVFGPMSLFALMAVWATGLITGFALLHWSIGTAIASPRAADDTLATYLYFSGTTFFTLGYGDLVPTGTLGRALAVSEAGIGFGFLAVVISYLPTLHQAFSRREIVISLLDARAGSPPSAGEILLRLAKARGLASVGPLLVEWERWAAEVLESHLSFPVLSFYRSQHDNQSWVGALTTILDTSALLIASAPDTDSHQARLTFAMARHASVDLGLAFQTTPRAPATDRLPSSLFARLRELLHAAGLELHDGPAVEKALGELRGIYEPFINSLADHLQFALPPFLPDKPVVDNWQTSAFMRRSPSLGGLPAPGSGDEHFG